MLCQIWNLYKSKLRRVEHECPVSFTCASWQFLNSRWYNCNVNYQIWPVFGLAKEFMIIIIICKFCEDGPVMTWSNMGTYGILENVTPTLIIWSCQFSNLSDFVHPLIICMVHKYQIKKLGKYAVDKIFSTISPWDLSAAIDTEVRKWYAWNALVVNPSLACYGKRPDADQPADWKEMTV